MNALILIVAASGCTSPAAPGPENVEADVSDPVPTSSGEAITDLTVDTIMGSTVKLNFTQVADANALPADYELRYEQGKLESWEDAQPVTSGTCAGRLEGTDVGEPYECTVENLSPGSTYELQATALERDEISGAGGTLSNIAAATPVQEEDETPVEEEDETPTQEEGELITRHSFTSPVEDGWAEPLGAFSHGTENGDGYGQANYEPNLCVGCAPINTWKIFDQDYDEITATIRHKVSPNMDFNTGSTNKKVFFLSTPTTSPFIFRLRSNGSVSVALQRTSEPPGGARAWEGGSWSVGTETEFTVYVKANSVDSNGNSNPDGILRVYVDGSKIIEATDVRYRGNDAYQDKHWEATDGISEIKWNPTWPNGGESPAESMWERIYDIAVWQGQV